MKKEFLLKNMNKFVFIFIFLIVGVFFIFRYSYKFEKDYSVELSAYNDKIFEELWSDDVKEETVIIQKIIVTADEISKLQMNFLYKEGENGNIKFRLLEEKSMKVLDNKNLDLADVEPNGNWTTIQFDKNITGIRNIPLLIELSFSENIEKANLKILLTKGNSMKKSSLYINDKKIKENIKMYITERNSGILARYAFFVDAILIALFLSFMYYIVIGIKIKTYLYEGNK